MKITHLCDLHVIYVQLMIVTRYQRGNHEGFARGFEPGHLRLTFKIGLPVAEAMRNC